MTRRGSFSVQGFITYKNDMAHMVDKEEQQLSTHEMKISFSFLFSYDHILLNCHSFPAIINYITNTQKIAATASTHKAKCPKAHRKQTQRKNYNMHRGL